MNEIKELYKQVTILSNFYNQSLQDLILLRNSLNTQENDLTLNKSLEDINQKDKYK